MSAEIAKLRFLPLPRWTAAGVAAVTVVMGLVLFLFTPSDPAIYVDVPSQIVSFAAVVAALVFGVWLSTLEFAAGTMQRTLTAEPDRNRVLASKLLLTAAVGLVVGVGAAAAAGGLARLAATHAGVGIDEGDLAGALFGQVPEAVAAAAIGFGFGLLTRSMGGGISAGLVFLLIFDGIVSFIPGAEDFTYGQLTQDLSNGITGRGDTVNGLGLAIAGVVVWCLIIIVPGWVRFLRSDLK